MPEKDKFTNIKKSSIYNIVFNCKVVTSLAPPKYVNISEETLRLLLSVRHFLSNALSFYFQMKITAFNKLKLPYV